MTESQFHSQITNSSPDLAKAEHLATQNLRKDAVDAGTAKPEIVEAEQRILESLKLLSTVRQSGEDQSPLLESSDGSPSAPTPADSPVLGDFRIMSEIAKGGMGVVYEAEQISLGRRVALKLLPFAANLDERHLLRFKNEACAAASLTHANIVPIYSIGCEQGLHFYAMQFIQGETLNNYITRADSSPKLTAASSKTFASNQPLTATKLIQDISAKEFPNHENAKIEVSVPKLASQLNDLEVPAFLKPRFESEKSDRGSGNFKLSKPIRQMRSIADWGRQVAEALAYAHSVGVIHRDVKPGNVMIDSASKAWIMDFGVALMKRDAGVTTTGDLVGTLRYMSPEQAAGKRGVLDHRTDIYSLGVTLYELLAQQNFFNEPDRGHLLQKILNDTPNYVRSINPSIPRDLATIVHKAIEREPKDRYNTADEMAEDLRRFLADQPILSKPPSISDRVKRCYRRNYLLLNFAFTSLLIIAITIGFAAISIRHERETRKKNDVLALRKRN